MSKQKKENKIWTLLAPVVVLVSICLVITAALAGTNAVTQPIIDAAAQKAADAALAVVLPTGEGFEEVALEGMPEGVTAASKAGNGAGFVFTIETKGYDQGLVVMVGLDANGAVSGVKVLASNETAGIGSNVVAEGSDFLKQLPGMTDTSGIQAVSGATMTSNGMKNAVQAAFDAHTIAGGGTVEAKVAARPASCTDDALAAIYPGAAFAEVPGGMVSDAGTVVFAAEAGMVGPVPVAVCFDPNGAIVGVIADTSAETPDYGQPLGENGYLDGFVGVASGDEVDIVSGATITSDAIKAGVNAAIANLETVKGAA